MPPAPMPEPSAKQKTLTLQCGSCTESLPAAVLTGGTSSVDLMTLRSFHRVVQFHYWPWPPNDVLVFLRSNCVLWRTP